MPQLRIAGEVRPTLASPPRPKRHWRTRIDPFADVWDKVCGWLEVEPDATATTLFDRMRDRSPRRYKPGQLRTLQHRVRGWRRPVARQLAGFCAGEVYSPRAVAPGNEVAVVAHTKRRRRPASSSRWRTSSGRGGTSGWSRQVLLLLQLEPEIIAAVDVPAAKLPKEVTDRRLRAVAKLRRRKVQMVAWAALHEEQ